MELGGLSVAALIALWIIFRLKGRQPSEERSVEDDADGVSVDDMVLMDMLDDVESGG